MKKIGNGRAVIRIILQRYMELPHALRSRRASQRQRAQRLLALTICIPLMMLCLGYMLHWEATRLRIERDNAAFSALYEMPVPTAVPTTAPTQVPTIPPAPQPTVTPVSHSTAPAITAQLPTAEPTQHSTAVPTPTSTPTQTPTASPTATPIPFEVAVDATIRPLATPDADTIIYAMETPPPAQRAFADLLALNPETVGFLRIGDTISLPVVQRSNDNSYYLNHSFNNEESIAGTLFLDGSNLLIPEDANLIIYGHNMRNGTMFRPLVGYERLDFLKENPLVRFDTIYRNRTYVPFAVFSATADTGSERYVDIRRFMMDETEWEEYIASMRKLSVHNIPVDVHFGDHVLLLVTCEYTHNNGRFMVALRALREGETDAEMRSLIQKAK